MLEQAQLDPLDMGDSRTIANPTFLDIMMHHTDGCSTRFTQSDSLAIQTLLDHLHPDKVFHQPQIYLADDSSLSIYQTCSVAWIEVVMDGFPDWHYRPSVDHVVAITEQEFRTYAEHPDPIVNGQARFLVVQIDMVNGDRHYQRIYGPQMTMAVDLTTSLKGMFHERRCLLARKQDVGAILINAANVKRMLYYPRSPLVSDLLPPGTWPAYELSVNGSQTVMRAA